MKRFGNWNKKRGQSTVEYVLILAAVVAAIFIFKDRFTGMIGGSVDKLGGEVSGGIDSLSDEN